MPDYRQDKYPGGKGPSLPEQLSTLRHIRWATFPLIGVSAVVAADVLRRAWASHGSAELWHALDPWLPTIIPAYAGYTVEPWPMRIWVSLLLALGLALTAFSTLVLSMARSRPWWIRAMLLWGSFVVVALGTVGVAQLGEWFLHVETFGGRGGSFVRTFAVPELGEAVRWGFVWGWIPALLASLSGAPRPCKRYRRVGIITCAVFGVAALVASAFLAQATYGASLSARTEVAQPDAEADAPASREPTDPPRVVSATADPSFPGQCAAGDVKVSIVGTDAATGTRFLVLEARNLSSASCELNGPPDVAFASEDGNSIYPSITLREFTSTGEPVPDSAIMLEPGDRARADLVWRAPTGQPTEIMVFMAPWAGAERVTRRETLDIVDGAEMELTRWYELGSRF